MIEKESLFKLPDKRAWLLLVLTDGLFPHFGFPNNKWNWEEIGKFSRSSPALFDEVEL